MNKQEAIRYYADNPNGFVYKFLNATPDKEQAKILKSLEDNPMTSVRVAGEFPKQAENIFIPFGLLEKSIMTPHIERKMPHSIHIGADIARFGSDKTVIGYKVDEEVG